MERLITQPKALAKAWQQVREVGRRWRQEGEEFLDVTALAHELGIICRTWMTSSAFAQLRELMADFTDCLVGAECCAELTFERVAVGRSGPTTLCLVVRHASGEREVLFRAQPYGALSAPSILLTTMNENDTPGRNGGRSWS